MTDTFPCEEEVRSERLNMHNLILEEMLLEFHSFNESYSSLMLLTSDIDWFLSDGEEVFIN
jgi:hypothetical protein